MSHVPVGHDRLGGVCRSTLTGWHAPNEEQETLRRHFLGHLDRHRDGWSRQCPGEHLTASALVCAPAQRLVLLTLHARLGRWLQTGGHLEPGDASPAAAALREAGEESGLPALWVHPEPLLLSRHSLSCGGAPAFHLDVQFLATTADTGTPVISPESRDVAWFGLSGLAAVDDSVRSLVLAAAARLGWLSGDDAQSTSTPGSPRPAR